MSNSESDVIRNIFFHYELKRIEKIKKIGTRFSHYTSAEAAISIIKNKSIWMRNSNIMNDYLEVKYGEKILIEMWNESKAGKRIKAALNEISPTIGHEITKSLNKYRSHRAYLTFITSISEHDIKNKNENTYGRLSMWRAYGGNQNVALIFNIIDLLEKENKLKLYASPVFYGEKADVYRQFEKIATNIENNISILKSVDKSEIINSAIWKFHSAALSIKHPGFQEEKEWRIIYSPSIMRSPELKETVQTIYGVPQIIINLNIQDVIDNSDSKLALNDIIHEIIIGPTQNENIIIPAIALELKSWSINDAIYKIKTSNIPLRR